MTVYGYARVSTGAQSTDDQVDQLQAAGCERIYLEKASGAGPAGRRRELKRMLATLQAGDVVTVTRLDRLGRSTVDLLNILAKLGAAGIGFRSLAEGWADTTTPIGQLLVTIYSGFAAFDREMILARTSAGQRRAKRNGVRIGRPPALNGLQRAYIADHAHLTIGHLARVLGVGRSTIIRARKLGRPPAADFPPQLDLEEAIAATAEEDAAGQAEHAAANRDP